LVTWCEGAVLRTRIKICGITRPEDAKAAATAGADAIGLVFHPPSPRNVDPETAAGIVRSLPPFVAAVALFMNAGVDHVRSCLNAVPLDLLQFHGDERPEFCRSFGRRYVKAVAMGTATDPLGYAARYPDAAGFLLDSHGGGRMGGTGDRFDWSLIPGAFAAPLILAGGLDPENVADGVRQVRPYAVDVSSGVEVAKGVKSAGRIAEFVREVRRGEGG
jgi:phosphoribosylanthranilate isomerase